MKKRSLIHFVLALTGVALTLAASQASAQDAFPSKTIRLIVPNPPGASLDIMARSIGKSLSESLRQPVVIENKPGVGTMLGADYVAKAAPDGYTLMLTSMSYTTSAATYPKLPFNPVTDLVGVTMVSKGPWLLVASPQTQAKTMKELIALAKAKPGALNYGSAGNGAVNHLWTELFKTTSGADIVHIPYKGASPAMTDLRGNHVNLFLGSLPSVWADVKAGKMRALAVTSAERSAFVPDVPSMAEATGLPGLELEQWWGVFAPAKTPKPIIDKLNQEINKTLNTKAMQEWLAAQGTVAAPSTPEAFTKAFRAEIDRWKSVVTRGNIKAN